MNLGREGARTVLGRAWGSVPGGAGGGGRV